MVAYRPERWKGTPWPLEPGGRVQTTRQGVNVPAAAPPTRFNPTTIDAAETWAGSSAWYTASQAEERPVCMPGVSRHRKVAGSNPARSTITGDCDLKAFPSIRMNGEVPHDHFSIVFLARKSGVITSRF